MTRWTRASDLLTREQIKALVRPSNLRGVWAVLFDWLVIVGSIALVAWRPAIWSVAIALILIGGRQLGLAILMHECSHYSLFRGRRLNDVVGQWLCAAPIWQNLPKYRVHHLAHHNYVGSDRDTDLGLVAPFPVSGRSLVRKLLRDISGLSALRRVAALLLMDLGYLSYSASVGTARIRDGRSVAAHLAQGLGNFAPTLLTNAALFLPLWLIGRPMLYLLWLGAYATTFSLFVRVRSIAEHACTEMTRDPLRNTRTTLANPLARATVAPHRVNFHLEHHLLMTVPYFRLPVLHRALRARGTFNTAPFARGYVDVVRSAVR